MEKQEFLGFSVGDIITLSDIQTQMAYNKSKIDFKISEVRVYKEPQGGFTYTAYIAEYKPDDEEEHQIMLIVLTLGVGEIFELRLFYLDGDGVSGDFEPLFMENDDDLVERFEVTLHIEGEDLPVTFDKQGPTSFGVEFYTNEISEPQCKAIAEYFTEDECRGNPHCFIEWTGDKKDGFIELWYGCEIKPYEVKMLKVVVDD